MCAMCVYILWVKSMSGQQGIGMSVKLCKGHRCSVHHNVWSATASSHQDKNTINAKTTTGEFNSGHRILYIRLNATSSMQLYSTSALLA